VFRLKLVLKMNPALQQAWASAMPRRDDERPSSGISCRIKRVVLGDMQICLQTKLTDIVKRKLLRKSKAAQLAALIRRAALARRTVVRADRHLTARKIASRFVFAAAT
jgi:hypothetical protein